MSHTLTAKCNVTSEKTLRSACERLGYKVDEASRVNTRTNAKKGLAITLPGWQYPVVYDLEGNCTFDNYSQFTENHPQVRAGTRQVGEEGMWGDITLKNIFEQEYALEALTEEALERGEPIEIQRHDATNAEVLVYV